jgi:hypothetical protein
MKLVPNTISESDLRDEVNRRTARAGYTSRTGEPLGKTKIMIQAPSEQYRKNYSRIFGHD